MTKHALNFKDNLPSLTLIQVNSQDLDTLKLALRNKVNQAPMMFIGMQVVLDLSSIEEETLDFSIFEFSQFLSGEGLNLVAVMSDKASHRQISIEQGVGAIPVVAQLNNRKKMASVKNTANKEVYPEKSKLFELKNNQQQAKPSEPRKVENNYVPSDDIGLDNRLINHPVRSGQRVYSRGDLTVVGSVSAGAEVIADGHIHVYGTLRGRAIAGAQGDESARIFCHRLEAELVSIAGNYKPNEEIEEEFRKKNVQISLEGKKICFLTL